MLVVACFLDNGVVAFSAAGTNETLIAFCTARDLLLYRHTSEAGKKLATGASQPLTRGITFKLAEKGKVNAGKSAVQVITFEVQKQHDTRHWSARSATAQSQCCPAKPA